MPLPASKEKRMARLVGKWFLSLEVTRPTKGMAPLAVFILTIKHKDNVFTIFPNNE